MDDNYTVILTQIKREFGKLVFKRIADLTENGVYVKYRQRSASRDILGGIDRLTSPPYMPTPQAVGTIESWQVSLNVPVRFDKNNRSAILTSADDCKPIQVIEVNYRDSVSEVATALRSGVRCELQRFDKFMFVPRIGKEQTVKAICLTSDMIVNDKDKRKVRVNDDVINAPVVNVSEDQLLRFSDSETVLYNRFDFPKTEEVVLFFSEKALVFKAIKETIAQKSIRLAITRNEGHKIQEFIDAVKQSKGIVERIVDYCGCSEEVAKEYLESFITKSGDYFEERFDEKLVKDFLESSDVFYQLCIDYLRESQKEDLEKQSQAATRELEELDQMIEDKRTSLEELKKEVELNRRQNNDLLSSRGEICGELDELRVKLARIREESTLGFFKEGRQDEQPFRYEQGRECSFEGNERRFVSDSINAFLVFLGEMLGDVGGVDSELSGGLSCFLTATFIEKTHVLLSGPHGEAIVNAVSIALYGRYADVLDCFSVYSEEVVEYLSETRPRVVIIKNAFQKEWIMRLPEMLNACPPETFVFVLHPYVEDMLIEPKGLYNYLVPLATDVIVKNCPNKVSVCSKLEPGVLSPVRKLSTASVRIESEVKKWINDFKCSSFRKNLLERLVRRYYLLCSEVDLEKEERLSCLAVAIVFPSLYFQGCKDEYEHFQEQFKAFLKESAKDLSKKL